MWVLDMEDIVSDSGKFLSLNIFINIVLEKYFIYFYSWYNKSYEVFWF